MSLTVDIVLDRFSKVYHEGDVLRGSVHVINAGIDTRFDSITITVEGTVTLQFGHRNAGPFEAFTSSAKTQSLLAANIVAIAPPGHFTAGLNEFPFECALTMQRDPNRLFETYHGAFVAINYAVRCEVRPSAFLAKAITRTQTFCVQNRPLPALPAARDAEVNFSISPETMARTAKERIAIPRFLVTGKLDRSEWCVTRPITGQLTVQHTEMAVKSIELQLIRVETSGNAEGTPSDATQIQTIHIVDGNVCPKLAVPIYMVLPRLFVCPALKTKNFKVDFEMNLVIAFEDNYVVTENFKLPLNRFASTGFML